MTDIDYTYRMEIDWLADREGVASAEGLPGLHVGAPPEFGGRAGVWTPEHLLVGAVASCFLTTFLAIAELSGLPLVTVEVPAEGALARGEDRKYRFERVTLRPRIRLAGEEDRERARRLVDKAEAACLVTRSLATEVVVEPVLEVSAGEPAVA